MIIFKVNQYLIQVDDRNTVFRTTIILMQNTKCRKQTSIKCPGNSWGDSWTETAIVDENFRYPNCPPNIEVLYNRKPINYQPPKLIPNHWGEDDN